MSTSFQKNENEASHHKYLEITNAFLRKIEDEYFQKIKEYKEGTGCVPNHEKRSSHPWKGCGRTPIGTKMLDGSLHLELPPPVNASIYQVRNLPVHRILPFTTHQHSFEEWSLTHHKLYCPMDDQQQASETYPKCRSFYFFFCYHL